jgi:uncharacterized membrane protein
MQLGRTHKDSDARIEAAISVLLRAGLILASAMVLAGGALYLFQHGSELPDYGTFRDEPPELKSLAGILASALDLQSRGIIQLGLLLLIATPVSRVIFSALTFLVRKDYLYVAVTVSVLLVLLFNIFMT